MVDQPAGDLHSQVWYLRERQQEVLKHLDRIDERIDTMRQRQDENRYRIDALERSRTIEQQARPASSMLDPGVVKVLVAVLAAAFLGLAGGRLATLVGLLS